MIPIPINPDSIGDPNQTPVVYIGDAGEVLGIPERRENVSDERATVPGWEGSVGPFRNQYGQPHVYARDVHSGAGNCVCGHALGESRHVQAAPGVPIPEEMRW